MKLMLVSCSAETCEAIAGCVNPLGFEIIQYRHAIKAMDNIDEVDPQGIVISARDFSRHWKAIVQFARSDKDALHCPIVILTGGGFSQEEAAEAVYLGVNGAVEEASLPQTAETILRCLKASEGGAVEEALSAEAFLPPPPTANDSPVIALNLDMKAPFPGAASRRKDPGRKPDAKASDNSPNARAAAKGRVSKTQAPDTRPGAKAVVTGFVCVNPADHTLVTGKAHGLTPEGLFFTPAPECSPLPMGAELTECSLRSGASILSPRCRLSGAAPNGALRVEFAAG